MKLTVAQVGDSLFLYVLNKKKSKKLLQARDKIAKDLDLIMMMFLHFVGLLIIQCLREMRLQIRSNLAIISMPQGEVEN